jgi:hypothetical protein
LQQELPPQSPSSQQGRTDASFSRESPSVLACAYFFVVTSVSAFLLV